MKKKKGLKFFTVVLLILAALLLAVSYLFSYSLHSSMLYGVSFDASYARFLGEDPAKVFNAILNDWQFKHIRLSAHWDEVETKQGTFDFAELDTWFAAAQKNNAKIVLAIGQKTPRWPECHVPAWSRTLGADEYQTHFKKYITEVVTHFKNNNALEIWQVENEPFLQFGTCPPYNLNLYQAELALVKELDSTHLTLTSDSGELSSWRQTATAADLFGTTLYRTVWNKYTGYWSYTFIPASFYLGKLKLWGRPVESTYVMELQAEPWVPSGTLPDLPLAEQAKSMDLAHLQKNIDFANRLGVPRTYLWGAEWWYWLAQKGESAIPDFIKNLKKF